MVHALREATRVLVPKGFLIDLRPLSVDAWLEVSDNGKWVGACPLDAAPGRRDDMACQDALGSLLREDALELEVEQSFDSAIYWGSADALRAHVNDDGGLSRFIRPTEEAFADLDRAMAAGGEGARIRLRDRMTIARYRRCK
jgi:hypothetical protein